MIDHKNIKTQVNKVVGVAPEINVSAKMSRRHARRYRRRVRIG